MPRPLTKLDEASKKSFPPLTAKSGLEDTTFYYVAEYSILLIRMAFCHAGFSFLELRENRIGAAPRLLFRFRKTQI